MKAVDAVIRARLHSDVVLVRQVAEYIVNAGGKRLRPALVLLSAGALGYRGAHHHELAAVVEMIHTSTLLHDDVVDESDLRRGRETANALFGNAASVLVGDFLYSRTFQMMVEVGSMRVMQVLSEATNIIAEGEVLQLMNCHDADVDEARYLQVIRFKTAKLFEAAAQVGAIVGGASEEAERSLAAYGMHLGTAFQIIDDLLDATDALLADDAPGWQAGEEDDSVTPRLDKQLLPLVRQQAYELQQLSSQLASLKDALEERKLIEKAKSLLMTHQGMQEEQAWQTLRKMAMDKNQRMVEIARALLMVKAIWPLTPKE